MSTPRLAGRHTLDTPFFAWNAEGNALFNVMPGVPADAALECASNLLASALGSATTVANGYHGELKDVLWSAVYLVEMAKAVVDGVLAADLATPH